MLPDNQRVKKTEEYHQQLWDKTLLSSEQWLRHFQTESLILCYECSADAFFFLHVLPLKVMDGLWTALTTVTVRAVITRKHIPTITDQGRIFFFKLSSYKNIFQKHKSAYTTTTRILCSNLELYRDLMLTQGKRKREGQASLPPLLLRPTWIYFEFRNLSARCLILSHWEHRRVWAPLCEGSHMKIFCLIIIFKGLSCSLNKLQFHSWLRKAGRATQM